MAGGLSLRVAGNARNYLAPWSAGTAYVVEAEGVALVVDCGLGTAGAIGEACAGRAPLAVAVSHFHFDHAGDLPAVAAALRPDTPILAPPGARAALDGLARAYRFEGAFDLPGPLREAPLSGPWTVGPFTLRTAPTRHSAPSFALSVEAAGQRVVLAGDGAPCAPLAELARGADLLLLHTLLPSVALESDHARIHMTGERGGALAREAGVGRLLLSHVYHGTDPGALAAATGFSRPEVAETGRAYRV